MVRDLMFKGKRRYRELLNSEERIATNILADRLHRLTALGLVTKTKDEGNRKSYVYRLSESGRDLAPLLLEMILWSGRNDPFTVVGTDYAERARTHRQTVLRDMKRAALD